MMHPQGAFHYFLLMATIFTIGISSLHFICLLGFVCYPQDSLADDAQWSSSHSAISCHSIDEYLFFCPKTKSSDGELLVKGFAVPLVTVTSLTYWLSKGSEIKRLPFVRGDPNVTFWTLVIAGIPTFAIVGIPLLVIFILGRPVPTTFYQALRRLFFLGQPTGNAAVIALAFFLIPVAKHAPMLKVFGLSYTQALEFHRVAGWISFVCTIVHSTLYCIEFGLENEGAFFKSMIRRLIPTRECWGLQMPQVKMERQCYILWMNFAGLVSTLAFVVLAITSLHRNRRRMYRVFYLVHIPCAWIMLLGAIAHISYISLYLFPGILCYLVCSVPVWVDQFTSRKGYQLESIQEIPHSNGCYEVRIPHDCSPSPYGEVIKICAPEISLVWHPFSVVRDPKNPQIMICIIRGLGTFSKSLRQRLLVDETSSDESVPLISNRDDERLPKLLLDGPYPAEYRWHRNSHTTMLLVAGGVGIVPFLPLLTDLQANPQNKLRRIVLHWYCREVGLAKHVVANYLHDYDLSIDSPSENHDQHDSPQEDCQEEEEDHLVVELFVHVTSRSDAHSSSEVLASEIRADELLFDTPNVTKLHDMGTRVLRDPRIALQPSHTSKWPVFVTTSGLFSICLGLYWQYYEHFVHHRRTILPRFYIILLVCLAVLIANVVMLLVRRIVGSSPRPEGTVLLVSHSTEHDEDDEDEIAEETPIEDDLSEERSTTNSSLRVVRKMKISCGRPSPTVVVSSLSGGSDSGAFFCGPTALRTSIKRAIIAEERGSKGLCNRFRCAIYDEESEM